MRSDSTPSWMIACSALPARNAPSAKLYSDEPRSSQWPSIIIWVSGFFFRYRACFFNSLRASLEISAESNAKNAWRPSICDGTWVHATNDNVAIVNTIFFIFVNPFLLSVCINLAKYSKSCQYFIFKVWKQALFMI